MTAQLGALLSEREYREQRGHIQKPLLTREREGRRITDSLRKHRRSSAANAAETVIPGLDCSATREGDEYDFDGRYTIVFCGRKDVEVTTLFPIVHVMHCLDVLHMVYIL